MTAEKPHVTWNYIIFQANNGNVPACSCPELSPRIRSDPIGVSFPGAIGLVGSQIYIRINRGWGFPAPRDRSGFVDSNLTGYYHSFSSKNLAPGPLTLFIHEGPEQKEGKRRSDTSSQGLVGKPSDSGTSLRQVADRVSSLPTPRFVWNFMNIRVEPRPSPPCTREDDR